MTGEAFPRTNKAYKCCAYELARIDTFNLKMNVRPMTRMLGERLVQAPTHFRL